MEESDLAIERIYELIRKETCDLKAFIYGIRNTALEECLSIAAGRYLEVKMPATMFVEATDPDIGTTLHELRVVLLKDNTLRLFNSDVQLDDLTIESQLDVLGAVLNELDSL